ncbi:MAG: hypothetical protein GKR95_18860 [Gammaproteobacteria bacterium]|nr:hypothetical protein [Gammaproteobacteria bacterium]
MKLRKSLALLNASIALIRRDQKKPEGTGLGLAIVNHIAMRHDATLIINSKVGKGSRFSVHFPLQRIKQDNDQVALLLH